MLPTLDLNSCNGSKKSKLESKAISALVAYGSDSSEDESEDKDDKSTILQRLQQTAELFKQTEMNKLINVQSPGLCETNGQPDILDIIGEEVPPDYVIEKPIEEKPSSDIFDILNSEVPPDYIDDTTNNNTEKDNELAVPSESKVPVKLQSSTVEIDSKLNCLSSNSDESSTNSSKESSLKSFNLIANYGEDDPENLGNKSYILLI